MRSLTVTVRIDIWAIVSCADLLEKHGLPTAGQPVSTIVRTALESITELLRQNGQIPDYINEKEVESRYEDLFASDPQISEGISLGGLDSILRKKSKDHDEIADIVNQVEEHLSPGNTPAVIRSTEPTRTADVEPMGADIRKIFSVRLEDLAKKAPKDKYIEICLHKDTDPIFVKAVEIAYSGLDVTEWGGPAADRLIGELMRMHKAEN